MRHQTGKSRRGANLAAARAVKAQRDADRIGRTLRRKRLPADVVAYIVRQYVSGVAGDDGTASLTTVQAGAANGTPGASLTLDVFERLAGRHTARRRGIVAAMREDNAGRTSARLAWPDTADRTPDEWHRRIVAPTSGIARLAWRETLVRHGAAAAADYAERHGAAWQYPARLADRPADRPTVVLATTTADRQALADGIA